MPRTNRVEYCQWAPYWAPNRDRADYMMREPPPVEFGIVTLVRHQHQHTKVPIKICYEERSLEELSELAHFAVDNVLVENARHAEPFLVHFTVSYTTRGSIEDGSLQYQGRVSDECIIIQVFLSFLSLCYHRDHDYVATFFTDRSILQMGRHESKLPFHGMAKGHQPCRRRWSNLVPQAIFP